MMMQKRHSILNLGARPSDADRIASIKWDPSPEEFHHVPFPSVASRFKVSALTILACLRFRHMMRLRMRLLRGTPLSHLRACVYAIVSITRLRTTLPRRRSIRREYLLSPRLPNKSLQHTFRSYGRAIIFCHKLVHKLHQTHLQCVPLEKALVTISEASNIKLDKAVNSGKCKVLLEVLSAISGMLIIMRFVLDNLQDPLNTDAFKGLSACYYSLKELCRSLLVCKLYIQDCTGSPDSRQVFAKLENVHTIKFLLLYLYKCYQVVAMKFDGFVSMLGDPLAQELAWESKPPCLPGSVVGHCLQLQAKKDLSHVLDDLKQHPKSFWSNFLGSWMNLLNASEDMALRQLLIARLNFPIAGRGEVEYLKKGMFVPKRHIRLVRFVGVGSYGMVEEVLCFGEKYAMKTIKGSHAIEDANEAIVQARLQHPNIVKLVWYTLDFDSQGSLSLLMDLMATSLEDYIEQQAHCPPSRLFNYPLVSLTIMTQIAAAMRYLHHQGIMHRDLKAANVLVDASWNADAFDEGYIHVKVADFGLAKMKQVGSQTQVNTRKVGTGYWRAPEVFWQEPSSSSDGLASSNSTEHLDSSIHSPNYSLSADVYSFAMTCYEIVSGKKPFANLLGSGMKQSILKERIAKFEERPSLPPTLHPGLRDLIEQCWDGLPENRPSFDDICEKLDQIRDDYVFGSNVSPSQDREETTCRPCLRWRREGDGLQKQSYDKVN